MYAEVIINSNAKALNKVFDYKVPDDMKNNIHIGSRVFVPFGNGKKLEDGFVVSLKEASEYECKEIGKIEIEESLTEENIALADTVVRIEMGNIDSLNVAVAGGILMNHYRG